MMVVVVVMMIIINITSSSSIKLVPMRFRGVQTPSLKSGWWQSAPSVEGCIPSVRMEGKSQGLLLRSFFCWLLWLLYYSCTLLSSSYVYIYIYIRFWSLSRNKHRIHQAQTLNKMTPPPFAQRPLATGVFQSNTQRIQVTKGIRRE